MKKFTRIFASLLMIAGITLAPMQAFATSNGLGVNPRRDYTIKPGETVNDSLVVNNLNKTDALYATVRVLDFSASDESGAPKLLLKQQEPTRWSLRPYLTIASNVPVPAGKSVSVPFKITMPKNIGAGSFYNAIQFSGNPGDAKGNVSLTGSAASLIFVRVPGQAKDMLLLNKFGAYDKQENAETGTFTDYFSSQTPKYFSFRLTNKGNVVEQPKGSIEIKNIFGKDVKIVDKANPGEKLVLIDQTRRFDVCPNEQKSVVTNTSGRTDVTKCNPLKLQPGRYTARLALVYGDNGSVQHEIGAVSSFWYLPQWFVALIVAILVVIAVIVFLIVRHVRSRRYSRRR